MLLSRLTVELLCFNSGNHVCWANIEPTAGHRFPPVTLLFGSTKAQRTWLSEGPFFISLLIRSVTPPTEL